MIGVSTFLANTTSSDYIDIDARIRTQLVPNSDVFINNTITGLSEQVAKG